MSVIELDTTFYTDHRLRVAVCAAAAAIVNSFVYSQTVSYEKSLVKGLAYYRGIEYSHKKIGGKNLLYSSELEKEYLLFFTKFSKAKDNILAFFNQQYDKFNEEDIFSEAYRIMDSIYSVSKINDELIYNTLLEIRKVNAGITTNADFPHLVKYLYLKNPEQEFLNGYIQLFESKGHPKSKGSDIKIKFPKSWISMEADRPNIIRKFITDYDSFQVSGMLNIRNTDPEFSGFTDKQISDYVLTKETANGFVSENGEILSFKKTKIEGLSCAEFLMKQKTERLGFTLETLSKNYLFLNKGLSYLITFSVVPKGQYTPSIQWYFKYEKLFQLIINSFILNDRYK